MSGVNKVILVGRLGRDPEVRHFQTGGKVVNLRVATSERYKDRDGNQQERTEWHSVAIFNEVLADVADRYLQKGSEVYLEGKLETRKWTDKEGVEKYTTEVVLRPFGSALQMLGGRGNGGGGDREGRADERPQERSAPREGNARGGSPGHRPAAGQHHIDPDDIPF